MPTPFRFCCHAIIATTLAASLLPAQAQSCSAHSGAQTTPVVELYTSEGCSSCPPADRWMSALTAEPAVVALAFHVDYWDSLGWADRFASPAYTQRQAAQQAVNGARFSYTPQVVIDGADRADWSKVHGPLATAARPQSTVQISMERHGEQVTATVQSPTNARLAAYWAVTESGHSSSVKGGENSGVTLKHDHVVRELMPVNAWAASAGAATTLQFQPTTARDASHPRQINLVVVNAQTGRPLQALKLGC